MNEQNFEAVDNEVVNLHYCWNVFRNVYAVEKNINLLNKFDGQFFGVVENLYWDSILLHISRLTDNEYNGSRSSNRNLSLSTIYNELENELDDFVKYDLKNKTNQINELVKKVRFHRSKRIAHKDLKSVFYVSKFTSKGISRNDIEEILRLIRDFMNIILSYKNMTEKRYDIFMKPIGGEILIHNLENCDKL